MLQKERKELDSAHELRRQATEKRERELKMEPVPVCQPQSPSGDRRTPANRGSFQPDRRMQPHH